MSGWEQVSMSSGCSVRENGSAGTWVMWLLSQMMRDRETESRCLLWVLVNTPCLSHQNLSAQKDLDAFLSRTPFKKPESVSALPVPVS